MRWIYHIAPFVLLAILGFSLCVRSAATPSSGGAHKRALLVGVSQYSRKGLKDPVPNLHSFRDVTEVKKALVKHFGFAPADVHVLTTASETTHKAIAAAFKKYLIDAAEPGDTIYFHFSGHGATTKDLNGDETMDGIDETLIPSDYVSARDRSNDILDDEVGVWINELSARRPANATLVFDCCHSGTITRGQYTVRGVPMRGGDLSVSRAHGIGDAPRTNPHIVVITACSPSQNAIEYPEDANKSMGLLTMALTTAMNGCTQQTTYADLMDSIESCILEHAIDQTPQLEGDPDLVVLGGSAISGAPHYNVRLDAYDTPYVDAGLLNGATTGSEFTLYPAKTKDFAVARPLCKARVIDASATTANLRILGTKPLSSALLRSARAVLTARQYGDNGLRIGLDGIPLKDPLSLRLKAVPLVRRIVTTPSGWDMRVRRVKSRGAGPTYVVERADGSLAGSADGPNRVEGIIKREAGLRSIRALTNQDSTGGVKVNIRLVPVRRATDEKGCDTLIPVPGKRSATGRLMLRIGDQFVVEARNTGTLPAHLTILDIQPDGLISPMYPSPKIHSIDHRSNVVNPDDKWHRLGGELLADCHWPDYVFVYDIGDPAGLETVKAIATSEPFNFSPLLVEWSARGPASPDEERAAESPIGRLLQAATVGTRSAGALIEPAHWMTTQVLYEIAPNVEDRTAHTTNPRP